MFKGIDHLVIVVKDLEQAAKDYEQLGFTVVLGGYHPVGSHNALISFRDGSYLELIAFYREAPDHRWWGPLQKGERLVDYCAQTDDLRGDTQKLRDAGVAINDPVPWSRTRPDGYELKWLLSLVTGSHRGVAPFLIQDVTPREERIPPQWDHKNGASGIRKLILAASDVSIIQPWYQSLGTEGELIENEQLKARGLRYPIGPHQLEFLAPLDSQSPLMNWIKTYGPSPYSALLETSFTATEMLDARLTHGANLYLTNHS
jgi:catechol 2,3-dioxygenase-like lactoylglutathione lyase family enzyme